MISDTQRDAYLRDGAIRLPGAIDAGWLERLADAIERDIESPGPCFHGYEVDGGGRFHGNMRVWEHDPDFSAYCRESPLPALAANLLGVDRVQLYYDQLFVKEAGTDAPTRWHNDLPYWPVRSKHIMSFWVALDRVTAESGALEFVCGSHRWGTYFQPEPFAKGGTPYERNPEYVPIPDIDANRKEYQFVGWDLDPGDVLAFDAMTVHGGPANRSAVRRRGYTVRYAGPDMTYYEGPGTSPFLHDPTLSHGQPIVGPRYPVVFEG